MQLNIIIGTWVGDDGDDGDVQIENILPLQWMQDMEWF